MGDTSPNHTSNSNRNPTFYHISHGYLGALGNRSLTPLKGSTKGFKAEEWGLEFEVYLEIQVPAGSGALLEH